LDKNLQACATVTDVVPSLFFRSVCQSAVGKPYSLPSFGGALAGATWQCVWF